MEFAYSVIFGNFSIISNQFNYLQPGSNFGQHRILRLLGRGGMGEVYEVEHELTGKHHALKLLCPEVIEVPGALELFEREAKVMARFNHPGVVRVDLTGEDEGRHWLRMELMPGRTVDGKQVITLEEYVEARGGRLPEKEVKSLASEILEVLVYAHDKGLVHRDLKPANILLDGEKLKIADFGLVNAAGADWMDTQIRSTVINQDEKVTLLEGGSRSRAIMGTYSFMSPEQKKGRPADARSDLYAVGLMVFRILTGEESPGLKLPSRIIKGLNPAWDDWLVRSLESAPADRFASACEMKESLDYEVSFISSSELSSLPLAYHESGPSLENSFPARDDPREEKSEVSFGDVGQADDPVGELQKTEIDLLSDFVGPRADYYMKKWAPSFDGTSTGFNWAAFFFPGLWLPYRKMYKTSLIFYTIVLGETILEDIIFIGVLGMTESPLYYLGMLISGAICGMFGNRWYLSHAQKKVKKSRVQGTESTLPSRGGTSFLKSLGFLFLFMVATLAIYIPMEGLLYPDWGTVLQFNNDEVYYSGEATEEDARLLEKELRKLEFFDNSGYSVRIHSDMVNGSRQDTVSFVLLSWAMEQRSTELYYRELGRSLVDAGFTSPLCIKFCDENLITHKTIWINDSSIP